jgi:DNA primase
MGPEKHQLYARIAIPLREFWTGDVVGWTGRGYSEEHRKYVTTLPRKIITGWRQRSASAPVVIVEGPFDGIAAHRAGFHAAVLSGVGSSGVEEFAARCFDTRAIVVMLDGDALDIARRLCWKIAALGRPVTCARLAPGVDPAALGPDGVRFAVENAIRASVSTYST